MSICKTNTCFDDKAGVRKIAHSFDELFPLRCDESAAYPISLDAFQHAQPDGYYDEEVAGMRITSKEILQFGEQTEGVQVFETPHRYLKLFLPNSSWLVIAQVVGREVLQAVG